MDLFSTSQASNENATSPSRDRQPLAERVRPKKLHQVLGQPSLVGEEGTLTQMLEEKRLQSFVLWGPPGCGKTTIARIIAEESGRKFVPFSAVLSGIKDVRIVMAQAELKFRTQGIQTVIFIDEIHRFNKAQQDAFLPFVEKGDIILIGATTENPSFEIVGALLSRLQVLVLDPIGVEALTKILRRALNEDGDLKDQQIQVSDETLSYLAKKVPGDARGALNLLEMACTLTAKGRSIDAVTIDKALKKVVLLYDKSGEEHYNTISALHKSIRNGDADASLYWLARMLEAGEDPMYVVRRLIRFASEDVGNADPNALRLAIAAKDAVHFIGMPEGSLALAQLVIYLAAAPKSNSVYKAYGRVQKDIEAGHVYPVPLAIRNAPTDLMGELGYGRDYEYAHNQEEKTTAMECLPKELQGREYYRPVEENFEKRIAEQLRHWKEVRRKIKR